MTSEFRVTWEERGSVEGSDWKENNPIEVRGVGGDWTGNETWLRTPKVHSTLERAHDRSHPETPVE